MMINISDVKEFINQKSVEYATSFTKNGLLRFKITFNKKFIITMDKNILYEGDNLEEAISIYNKNNY